MIPAAESPRVQRALLLLLITQFWTGYCLSTISFESLQGKNILVIGGSGRVGGSVVTQLVQRGSKVSVGGTSRDHFSQAQARWTRIFPQFDFQNIAFHKVDREVAESITPIIQDYDLVIHTAGPFQGKVKTPNGVLEACVRASVPYLDVCDDYCTASAAKAKYASQAKVPCIVSTGTWPGVSSLLAKQLVHKALAKDPSLQPADLKVDFGFFTAGSGGAGVTLLVATFLILAEKALTIVDGRRIPVPPLKDFEYVNFGDIVGDRAIAPLNLLETASVHDYLGVGSTSAKFGTAPSYWNTLLGLFGSMVPKEVLENEPFMRKLSVFSMPIVRIVDFFAGATNAIRVDLSAKGQGKLATAIYAHENLEPCVGESIIAFAAAALTESAVPPGVWFTEEAIAAGDDCAAVLHLASVGAHTCVVEGLDLSKDEIFGSSIKQRPKTTKSGKR